VSKINKQNLSLYLFSLWFRTTTYISRSIYCKSLCFIHHVSTIAFCDMV